MVGGDFLFYCSAACYTVLCEARHNLHRIGNSTLLCLSCLSRGGAFHPNCEKRPHGGDVEALMKKRTVIVLIVTLIFWIGVIAVLLLANGQ